MTGPEHYTAAEDTVTDAIDALDHADHAAASAAALVALTHAHLAQVALDTHRGGDCCDASDRTDAIHARDWLKGGR